jgi:hypothetical protein
VGNRARLALGLLLLGVAISSCATISPFSEVAYQQAITLKVQSLALMEKADEPFADHRGEVDALRLDLQKAHEYARGRRDNEDSTEQWQVLIAPEGHLLGGFLRRWESDGTLSRVFIEEEKGVIGDAFDKIIDLESGKPKPKAVGAGGI